MAGAPDARRRIRHIADVLNGELALRALVILCAAKLVSWALALGSGTSGGTLAPLFTIGGAGGALVATGAAWLAPNAGIDPRVGALVGMAAMFAGASRALLASVVFAFETTQQPMGLLPLLGGCSAAYFVSCAAMPNSIMTEKLARRGLRVTSEYAVDHLESIRVMDRMTRAVVSFEAETTLTSAQARLALDPRHQAFPVIGERGELAGVVTRREVLASGGSSDTHVGSLVRRRPVVVHPDNTLREAADHMVGAGVGRVVVIERAEPCLIVGMLTRSDLLDAHGSRLSARDDRRTVRAVNQRAG